jgi:septal ring factor EnvC (AmiA/AmiB activator)
MFKKKIPFIFFIIIFLVSFSAYAKISLSDIKKEIQAVQKDLQVQHTSHAQLQKKLKVSEENLSRFKTAHEKTRQELKKQNAQLNKLHQEKEGNEKKLAEQQQALSDQIRAAYMSGNGGFLKILLSQENVADIQKNLIYYRYILKQRSDLIAALRQTTNELEKNTQEIKEKNKTLSKFQRQQQAEISDIQAMQTQRTQVLKETETTIASGADRLRALKQDRAALETVLNELKMKAAAVNAAKPAPVRSVENMSAKEKTKAGWPIAKGKIAAKYGSSIEGSQLKLNGVLIEAPQGENVRAVSSGSVVFSQWMAGYGLLVIVDHGNSYMTLYGRNDVVYRKVGDKVSAGDVLATVGKSGGYTTPALYFAVRKDGKAMDPCIMVSGCAR